MNADDAETLISEARSRGLFFAEAMWMRTNPNIRKTLQLVARRRDRKTPAGTCRARLRRSSRLAPGCGIPTLGASALLDVGIYPLTFAYLVLGEPDSIVAAGVLSDQGIDVNGGATLTYDSGAVANIAWNQVRMV